MKIYIAGVSGTGMGPLALMARAAGHEVCGSDVAEGAILPELLAAGIEVKIGKQDGEYLREKIAEGGVDWYVHTSAMGEGHPEVKAARAAGVKCTKRDELTAHLIRELGLKLVAVAGTHGKTTTTAMIVWACHELGIPVAYLVGTTLGFLPSGAYTKDARFFVYEADEYDRNFLKYRPWLAVLPYVSYDHPDIYPTREDYAVAFEQFKGQSEVVIEGPKEALLVRPEEFTLAGAARRWDAALAATAVMKMANMTKRGACGALKEARDNGPTGVANKVKGAPSCNPTGVEDKAKQARSYDWAEAEIVEILNRFPGVGRRFERLLDGIYTDYAHHPEEIAATLEVAREAAEVEGRRGVVAIYQPHQNTRQHEVRGGYKDAFTWVEKVYWLPTYLTREDPKLPVLAPAELYAGIEVAEAAEMNEALMEEILRWRDAGYLVVLMTAGPADEWLRHGLFAKGKTGKEI